VPRPAHGRRIWAKSLPADFHGERPMWSTRRRCSSTAGRPSSAPAGKGRQLSRWTRRPAPRIWRGGADDIAGYGTPVITTLDGRRQYVMTVWKGFVGSTARPASCSGGSIGPRATARTSPRPIVVDGGVFITSSYGMGCALLDIQNGNGNSTVAHAHHERPLQHACPVAGQALRHRRPWLPDVSRPRHGETPCGAERFEKGGAVAVDGTADRPETAPTATPPWCA